METRQEKSHSNTAGPLISHSTASKNVLNDLDLLYKQSNMTKMTPCSPLRDLDNMANGVSELYFGLK